MFKNLNTIKSFKRTFFTSITSSTITSRTIKKNTIYSSIIIKNVITERSFLSNELKAAGIKVEPSPPEPLMEVTPETLEKPNERVAKLVDELLNLNLVEIGMFFKAVQVSFLLLFFDFLFTINFIYFKF